MRPANVVTANADILAGFAAASGSWSKLPWLLAAGSALYAGGVVLNDVFDASLDARERPERPIPSGRISRKAAAELGAALLGLAIICAAMVSWQSAALASGVALSALLYDALGKHQSQVGPLNMGLCRGLNLLLGVSAVPAAVPKFWYLALIPIAYIAAITAVSRGEVNGDSRGPALLALILQLGVGAAAIALMLSKGGAAWWGAPFLLFWGWRVLPRFVGAYKSPEPAQIRSAVKAGVLSLIALDSVLAAVFAGPVVGICVLALLLIAALLARQFAVT